MPPDSAKLLWDASDAAQRITRFVGGRTLDQYLADDLLRSAVERQFEIIGEALGRLRQLDPTMADQIPDLRRVVDFRNVLIHAYSTVDDRLVWEIVQTSLPGLSAVIGGLLPEG